jgi:hypothetical protein
MLIGPSEGSVPVTQNKWFANSLVLIGFLVASLPLALVGQTAPVSAADAHRRAEELLKQMTIEEKVGQMNQSSGIVMPLLADEMPDGLIVQGKVGSILWLIDVRNQDAQVPPRQRRVAVLEPANQGMGSRAEQLRCVGGRRFHRKPARRVDRHRITSQKPRAGTTAHGDSGPHFCPALHVCRALHPV